MMYTWRKETYLENMFSLKVEPFMLGMEGDQENEIGISDRYVSHIPHILL